MKPMTGTLVRAMNETLVRIALSEARSEELVVELGQLCAGAEAIGARIDFDSEPSDFRAALLALAQERNP